MARASSTDFFHSMRFHVTAQGPGGFSPFSSFIQGGFSSCSVPELTTEAVTYREGHSIYEMKFPGSPTVSDVTLQRGVVLRDTTFADWCFRVAEGSGQYRVDLTIHHFHRDAMQGKHPSTGKPYNTTQIGSPETLDGLKGVRKYVCHEAFPIRFKPAGDLDATSSDISVAEMDVACEYFEQETVMPAEVTGV